MRRQTSSRTSAGRLVLLALVLCAAAAGNATGAATPDRTGAVFTSEISADLSLGTAKACLAGTPFANYVMNLPDKPTLWWRFTTPVDGTTVKDVTGNGNDGSVRSVSAESGLTLSDADTGLPSCDTTGSVSQEGAPGDTGFIVAPVQTKSPTTLTMSVWVRSKDSGGGRLVGFGDSAKDKSTVSDRALLLDAEGHPVFSFLTRTGLDQVSAPDPVTDGLPHLLVATMFKNSVSLYVDGALVASNDTVDLADPYPGFWRSGYDALNGIGPTKSDQAAAVVDEVTVWDNVALDSDQVRELAAANHW